MARLATILSFGDRAEEGADAFPEEPRDDYQQEHDDDDAASDASSDSFEFSFARPLALAEGEHPADALADDLFAHGRMLPAYPVFHRRQAHDDDASAAASSATAPPSPDTYCAWAPRSAPGSPAREPAAFPKSASTGTGETSRRFRLRDILGSSGRSHSDGKEKFLFLQPTPAKPKPKTSALSTPSAPAAKKTSQSQQKQSKKKAAAAPTEMDMATAHRLFYSKPGAAAGPGGERTANTKTSYLPYRPAIVGFFATAHALRPKHHPY